MPKALSLPFPRGHGKVWVAPEPKRAVEQGREDARQAFPTFVMGRHPPTTTTPIHTLTVKTASKIAHLRAPALSCARPKFKPPSPDSEGSFFVFLSEKSARGGEAPVVTFNKGDGVEGSMPATIPTGKLFSTSFVCDGVLTFCLFSSQTATQVNFFKQQSDLPS